MKKLIATFILIAGIAQAEHVITIQITIPERLEENETNRAHVNCR